MANIQDVRATQNIQKNYEFEVELVGSAAGGNIPILVQRVQSASIPEESVDTIEINYKSSKSVHAGRDASGRTFTVTYWEDEANEIYNYHKQWLAAIRSPEDGSGVTRDQYAAEMNVKRFASDETTVTLGRKLTNVFPTSIGDIQLSYDGSEVATVEVTYSFGENLPL